MHPPAKRLLSGTLILFLGGLAPSAWAIDPEKDRPDEVQDKIRAAAKSFLEKTPRRLTEIAKDVGVPVTLLPEDIRFERAFGRAKITWLYSGPEKLSEPQSQRLRNLVEDLVASIARDHPTEEPQLLSQQAWDDFRLSLDPRSETRAIFVEPKSIRVDAQDTIIPHPVSLAGVYPYWPGHYGYHFFGFGYLPYFTPVAALPYAPAPVWYPYYIPWASPFAIPFPGYVPKYLIQDIFPGSHQGAFSTPRTVTVVTPTPTDFASLVSEGRQRMGRDDLSGAVECLTRAVEKDSRSAVAWYLKAAAEFRAGLLGEAKESAARGKACEMAYGVPSAEIAVALEKVQGTPRQFIEKAPYPESVAKAREIANRSWGCPSTASAK